jgi:Flp pilus assembly pilin Flp
MDPLIRSYVLLVNFSQDRIRQLKERRDDQGASLIEYGGLLALIGAIVAAVVALNLPQTISQNVGEAVTRIFSGKG